jgi:hypothetical protein
MSRCWIRLVTAAFFGCLLLGPAPVRSHEFSLESVMNAFVEVAPGELHLVVRVPLHLLGSVKFPAIGRELDLPNLGPATQRTLAGLARDITIEENGRALVPTSAIGRPSLPSDRSFERFDEAVAHVAQPVAAGTGIYYDQGYFDAHLTYRIASANSEFTIRTTVAPELKDYLKFSIRYLTPGEEGRAMVITRSSGAVPLNPTRVSAARGFIAMGVAHILTGVDHLLFLLCLVIPLRNWREILVIITGFTVAHSITLIGSSFNLGPQGAWFPPFVETMIAVSIVYMALENIVGVSLPRRLVLTGLFGLVHGFGFSYGLQESLQFAGSHLLISLLAFNVGIELGQVLVLAVMLPVLALVSRYVLAGRVGMIILSAIVAHIGWHWMIDRADVLWKIGWPRLDAVGFATLAAWVAALLFAAMAVGFLAKRAGFTERYLRPGPDASRGGARKNPLPDRHTA